MLKKRIRRPDAERDVQQDVGSRGISRTAADFADQRANPLIARAPLPETFRESAHPSRDLSSA